MSVADIEQKLQSNADKLGEVGARVKFDFGDDRLLVDGTHSPATISHEDGDADCTLVVSADDMAKVMAGQLDPTMAVMTGKIKLKGSTAIAMKLAPLLK
jgi:putative sterol carrier protein